MNLQRKPSAFEGNALDGDAGNEPHNETVFDLADFIRVVRVRKRVIIGTAIMIVAVSALVLFQMTRLYTAGAVVMLDQQKNKVVDIDAVLSGLPTDPSSIENQVQILTSRNLLGRVIDKLHLEQDSEFSAAPKTILTTLTSNVRQNMPASLAKIVPVQWYTEPISLISDEQKAQAVRNLVIDRLLAKLTVTAQGRSTAIKIGCDSISPVKAAQICNAIADFYVEDQLNAKFEATQATTKWLADRIDQLSSQVQTTEAAVQAYRAEHNLAETGSGSVIQQQLGAVNGQLVVARADLAEQEARYARVVEMQRSGHAADVLQVVASPLIAQLRNQQAELIRQQAELSSRYGPRHPKMLDIESQKRNLDQKIEEEVQRVAQTSASDVAVARARVKSLQEGLSQLSAQATQENKSTSMLSGLNAAAASSRSLYEAFLSRFKETQGQQDIQTPDARVISRAEVPKTESYPNKPLFLGIALPAGLMLGLFFAMLAERLDAGFRTGLQIERLIGLPVLTVMPEIRNFGASPADRVIDKPMSAFAESIRGLQMGLTLSNVDKRPKVVVVTSSLPNEGKTTVAVSLARLAARSGRKVVLVDGDLRHPNVAEVISAGCDLRGHNIADAIGRKETSRKQLTRGIIDALTGESPLAECLMKDERSGMAVLPAVGKARSPADLLGSVTMERIITELKDSHDLVVIDSAPLLPVNDTKVLAHLADAVVFVVRWEKTPREAVISAARALADLAAPVAGVVLARADDKRYRYYSYGYRSYYDYDKYYTD